MRRGGGGGGGDLACALVLPQDGLGGGDGRLKRIVSIRVSRMDGELQLVDAAREEEAAEETTRARSSPLDELLSDGRTLRSRPAASSGALSPAESPGAVVLLSL